MGLGEFLCMKIVTMFGLVDYENTRSLFFMVGLCG